MSGEIGKVFGALVLAVAVAAFGGNSHETVRTSRSGAHVTTAEVSSGIQTGEWKIEGETAWDYASFEIDEDSGNGAEVIANLDANDLATEVGYPLVGEADTEDGCRMFIFSGPLGVPMQAFFCAGGGYVMWGAASDRDVSDYIVASFANGEAFVVPNGWHEVGE